MHTIYEGYNQHIMPTYGRFEVAFVKGDGSTLYDADGKSYLDFASGIGVNSVGYAHPEWVKAVSSQASALAHVSNLYYTQPALDLAGRLTELSGMRNVFFANSGAEANEGMIKLARKYSQDNYKRDRTVIVTLRQSFHGRTVTTLSATGQDQFHQNFQPFTEGFVHVQPHDLDALHALGDDVCAIMLEVVQGEGGVLPLERDYLHAVQELCRKRDWLLLLDEVQTGIGRCGSWFAFQQAGLAPDVVSFAKGVAGGLPLGGLLANERCAGVLSPGTHATTFGGNPICCAAGVATLKILEAYLPQVEAKGQRVREALRDVPGIKEVRGSGLMLGIEIEGTEGRNRKIVQKALNKGLVCLTAGHNVVRLLPPLVITEAELDAGLTLLRAAMAEC